MSPVASSAEQQEKNDEKSIAICRSLKGMPYVSQSSNLGSTLTVGL